MTDPSDPDVPVNYHRQGPVAVVEIDRPDVRNAVDRRTAEALGAAWDRFADDENAAVGVLTGAGEDFSAGADLEAMDLEDGEDGWLGFTRRRIDKPTVAAVEGHCVAGGLEMALWCDIRVAAEGTTFGCFERRFGVPLVDGGTQRPPRVVGLGRALDMILTGRAVNAETAREWGLVTRLAPDGDALDVAVEVAERIASFPQETVRTDRAAVYDGLGTDLDRGLRVEAWHGTRAMEAARGGAARFAAGEGRGGDGIEDPDGGE
ncbi:crotonase/enoyl-CoA hydratase family protein [Halobacteriales archaeon QS_8_69_26]|nr:MAG: crotonase/enoyl-CoA hydratase family protein [Halobacteriales archaeon QS_8_69_26]